MPRRRRYPTLRTFLRYKVLYIDGFRIERVRYPTGYRITQFGNGEENTESTIIAAVDYARRAARAYGYPHPNNGRRLPWSSLPPNEETSGASDHQT